jgi:hypothetical protein
MVADPGLLEIGQSVGLFLIAFGKAVCGMQPLFFLSFLCSMAFKRCQSVSSHQAKLLAQGHQTFIGIILA